MTHIKFSSENKTNAKTIDLKTGCDMFFYPTIDAKLFPDSNGNITIPYVFISRSGSDIGKVTVNIENLTENTNSENIFNVIDNGGELVLEGASLGNAKISFTIEGNTEELKANVLGEYSTVIMSLLTIYRSTDSSLVPSNVSNTKTVVSDRGNGEYEIMLYSTTSTNHLDFSDIQTLTNVSYISNSITDMSNTYYNCKNLTGSPVCRANVTNMVNTYHNCCNLTGSPVCGDNVTTMAYTYTNCSNLTGSPVCRDNVTNMYRAYYNCYNLTGSPVCGNKVEDMYYAYHTCRNLTGSPVCGDNVTNMYCTYYNCSNLTGSPVCGPNVTSMFCTYWDCFNITGQPVCGDNVTTMLGAYHNCFNLTGSPVCGDNVTNMGNTYYNCRNLTGSPVCGDNVTNMGNTYYNCRNLTGSPVCRDNVTNMYRTYYNCSNLTGSPVCGNNVTDINHTYYNCRNLTGSPVCGDNVADMASTYDNCYNLTGSPVCGSNVTNMVFAYYNCIGLTGSPVCGPNVTNMYYAYCNCIGLSSNGYFCSNKITNVCRCFGNRNISKRLKLYVPESSTTLNTCLYNNTYSLTGVSITWTNDMAANRCYYNTAQNIYIYPVANVADAYYKNNPPLIVSYETTNPNNEQLILAKDIDAVSNYEYIPLDTEGIKREITNINDTTYNVSIYKTDKSLDIGFVAFGEDQNLTKLHSIGNCIQDIVCAYCLNLKGAPLCGSNSGSYLYCVSLTGPPVCAPNATNMYQAYYNCISLTGSPICGPNVINMSEAYHGCKNLSSNGYFCSNKVTNVRNCFGARNTSNRLNLYVPANSTTLTTCLYNNSHSLAGVSTTWINNVATNGYYFNTTQNIYIYPVANVEQAYKDNEK